MAKFCRMAVMGNVGGDPEMRYTPNGTAATQFSVASGNSRKNQQTGEWEDDGTDWFRVTVWGQKAETAAEKVRKGAKVLVEGRFRSREFEDKTGAKRVSMEITADDWHIIAEPGERTGSAQRTGGDAFHALPKADAPAASPAPRSGFAGRGDDLDDLPF